MVGPAVLQDGDVPQPGDGLGAQHEEEGVQPLDVGEEEGLLPKLLCGLGEDRLGGRDEVRGELVLLSREAVARDLGPLAVPVPPGGKVVGCPDVVGGDMDGGALVSVGEGPDRDAVRVNQGLVVNLQAKLWGEVPGR